MEYLTLDKNNLIWLVFTFYTVSAIFIIPNNLSWEAKATADNTKDRAIKLASNCADVVNRRKYNLR